MLDGGAPHGRHYYWKSHRLPEINDEVIEVVMEHAAAASAPFWQMNGWAVGGAVTRIDADATAVGPRETGFDLNITAAWPPPIPTPRNTSSGCVTGGPPFSRTARASMPTSCPTKEQPECEAAYGDRLSRLTALKDRYDPGNFFSMNANIPPST